MNRALRSIARPVLTFTERCTDYMVYRCANNIGLRLQLNALESSAQYVETAMGRTPGFNNKWDLLAEAIKVAKNRGLILEFGVYTGGTINFIADRSDRTVHGFDSFEGLPEFWRDNIPKGHFSLNGKFPKVRANVELHAGWFNETLPEFLKQHREPVSLLHIDSDIYSSAKTVFENLGTLIGHGTVIVFDEYFNYPSWQQGEFKAFQEFLTQRDLTYCYLGYVRRGEQVAVVIC